MVINDQKIITDILNDKYNNILLVEPKFIKHVPLGLSKIYTFFKHYAKHTPKKIDFVVGRHKFETEDYDAIFIASGSFSYYHDEVLKTVRFYSREYPNSKIVTGGVYSIGSERYRKEVLDIDNNINVISCLVDSLDNELEFIDYSLYDWNPWEFVFTSRGCKRNCKFCYVKTVEPTRYIVKNWKNQILNSTRRNVIIHDNNFNSFDIGHIKDVTDTLIKVKKPMMVDNGLDCRVWNSETSKQFELLQKNNLLRYSSIRFAFDNAKTQDGYIQRTIEDISRYYDVSNILVFVLINFDTDIDDCYYRANEIVKCGAFPFLQYYAPLDYTDDPFKYKGEFYTPEIHLLHKYFNEKKYREISYDKYKLNLLDVVK